MTVRGLLLALLAIGLASEGQAQRAPDWLVEPDQIKLGIGDRIRMRSGKRADGDWRSLPDDARSLGLRTELFQIWLPKGWSEEWVSRDDLVALSSRGITPVLVHYYYGDDISKEHVERERSEWYASLWRLTELARIDAPVLVILEPEFNNAPPRGETAILDWPWFGKDLAAGAKMIRERAPNTLVGTCPGDFPGPPRLEGVLTGVADDLDFIAFQEMRATTDPDRKRPGYEDVAGTAVAYAQYLQRAFGRPILIGYVAISSYGRWEKMQSRVFRGFADKRQELLDAGVFGFVYFQLRDDPAHTGYFGKAERHFGLVRADGTKKPGLRAFRDLGKHFGAEKR